MSDRIKDVRGVAVKPGDVVCVGTRSGSSGGYLTFREVVDVRDGAVWMKTDGKGRLFKYTAACGFLILPREYRDVLGKTRWW